MIPCIYEVRSLQLSVKPFGGNCHFPTKVFFCLILLLKFQILFSWLSVLSLFGPYPGCQFNIFVIGSLKQIKHVTGPARFFFFFLFLLQTQIMYKWIEPKICREDLTDAIRLPPSGEKKDCPPCNPGFYNNGSSSCHPCPPGTFSDGTKGMGYQLAQESDLQ